MIACDCINYFVSDLVRQTLPENTALLEAWVNCIALPDLQVIHVTRPSDKSHQIQGNSQFTQPQNHAGNHNVS